jgi:methionyl-tRNA formyltransferase
MMRIVFMGTPRFAATCVKALALQDEHELVAVYSRPDAASRRGHELHPAPAKVEASRQDVPVYTPRSFDDQDTLDELAALEPDVIITAAYGVILPQEVLDIPRYGCLNVHASLLPRWRGAAPIQRAILANDDVTGVSIMRMTTDLDCGDVCYVSELDILDRNTEDLTAALARLAVRALPIILEGLEEGTLEWKPQDDSLATYAPKVKKDELLLAPDSSAEENLLRVRASTSSNPAKAFVCDRSITVLKAHVVEGDLDEGTVSIKNRRVTLGTADGALALDEVKPDGRNAMTSKAWLLGLKNAPLSWRAL